MSLTKHERREPGYPAVLAGAARATAYLAGVAATAVLAINIVHATADTFGRHAFAPPVEAAAKAPASTAALEVEHRVLQEEWFRSFGRSKSSSSGSASSSPPPRFDRNQRNNQVRPPEPPPFWLGSWGDGGRRDFWYEQPDQPRMQQQQQQYRTYRTVCVRLCDGFYFPISFAATKDRFARDEAACQASCGAAAKLYVYRNPGEDPDQMVDLRGQPYARLKTAFLYRTSYDESCKCRPHSWEQVSLDRHRMYALEARRRKGDRSVQPEMEQIRERQRQTLLEQRTPRKQSESRRTVTTKRIAAATPGGPATSDISPAIAAEAAPAPEPVATPVPRGGEHHTNVASVTDTVTDHTPALVGRPPTAKKSRPKLRPRAVVQRTVAPASSGAAGPRAGNFGFRNVFER